MVGALTLYHTTIGKKVVMAVTGFILYGYVMVHMLGNLKVFQGPEKLNAYGVFLRTAGGPVFADEQVLWLVRIILLISLVAHIVAAVQLTRLDWESRPVGYAMRKNQVYGYAAPAMRWGGIGIALFVVYHILHFTTGQAHPSYVHGDIYRNVVVGFQSPIASLVYIAAMIAVGLHLYHGVWSMFQTLGLNNTNNKRLLRGFATLSAVALVVGNVSIPVAVMLGLVR